MVSKSFKRDLFSNRMFLRMFVHNNLTFCIRIEWVSKRRNVLQVIPKRVKLFWRESNNHCMFSNLHFISRIHHFSLKFSNQDIPICSFCLKPTSLPWKSPEKPNSIKSKQLSFWKKRNRMSCSCCLVRLSQNSVGWHKMMKKEIKSTLTRKCFSLYLWAFNSI